MSSAVDPPFLARIAKLQLCCDTDCPFSLVLAYHLKIDYDYINLADSRALAVSYTWGEFDREEWVIGHDADGVVSMTLGSEWNIEDTIGTLARLCNENGEEKGMEHAGLWVDQLCINQEDEDDIRATLANIPDVYRALEVVLLMPGGICSCARDVYKKLIAMHQDEDDTDDYIAKVLGEKQDYNSKTKSCLNYLGICSYFDRVWTRQEMLYAGTVRIVRTKRDELPCFKDQECADSDELNPFARLLSQRHHWGWGKIIEASHAFWGNLEDAVDNLEMEEYPEGIGLDTRMSRRLYITLHWFLLGGKLVRAQEDRERTLFRFLFNLERLTVSTRKATKARDYVVSVWVDCPGYIVPQEFKRMSLPLLLQNAVLQLEKMGVSILVSRMQALFKDTSNNSILWRPETYLGGRIIQNTTQIYETILQMYPIPLTTDHKVPIRISVPFIPPLSEHARDYSDFFSGRGANYVLNALSPIMANWKSDGKNRTLRRISKTLIASGESPGSILFDFKLLTPWASEQEGYKHMVHLLPAVTDDFDHHQAVYKHVAIALGLDVVDCQNNGLRLVLIPGVRIGLTSTEVRNTTDIRAGKVITVCMIPPHVGRLTSHGYPALLEAALTGEVGRAYSVTGLWVPSRRDSADRCSAYADLEYPNAILG